MNIFMNIFWWFFIFINMNIFEQKYSWWWIFFKNQKYSSIWIFFPEIFMVWIFSGKKIFMVMNIFGESEIWIQEGWTTWRFQIWIQEGWTTWRRKLINFAQLVHFHRPTSSFSYSPKIFIEVWIYIHGDEYFSICQKYSSPWIYELKYEPMLRFRTNLSKGSTFWRW